MLDKKQIWRIFLFEFKMGYKAAEKTHNINNTLGPGTANECTVQRWYKKFCKGDKRLEDEKHSGQPSEGDNNGEAHRSWSSYGYLRSCRRTQCRPFYSCSVFEANWKGERAQQVGVSWAGHASSVASSMSSSVWPEALQPARLLCPWDSPGQEHWSGLPCPPQMRRGMDLKSKKLSFLKGCLLLFYTTMNHFSTGLWCAMKRGLYTMTSSVIELRSSKALPKAKVAPKKGHGHCSVVCCPSDLLQLSDARETMTSVQQIDERYGKLQCLQPALVTGRAPSFPTTPDCRSHNQHSKVEWTGLGTFASFTIFTWSLTNGLPLLWASRQLFAGKTQNMSL